MKNPLSLEAFADWCEKQPAERKYTWFPVQTCACTQYADAIGVPFDKVAFIERDGGGRIADAYAHDKPHTFGALAQRLRAAQ